MLYFFLKRVETGKTVDLVECIYTSGATLFLMATTAASTTTILHINVLERAPCLKIHQNCAILGGEGLLLPQKQASFLNAKKVNIFLKKDS